jgi:hypothetical protein
VKSAGREPHFPLAGFDKVSPASHAMKNRILPRLALVFVLSAGAASAIQLKDAVGRWTGRHQETRGGVGSYTHILVKGKRLAGGGLLLTEKGNSAELGRYVTKYRFTKRGGFTQTTVAGGFVLQSATGTWEKMDGKIVVSGIGQNAGGSHEFRGTLRATAGERVKYTGRSGDVTVKIDGRPL